MSLADLKAALSQASNLSQLKGLSAAYGTLLSGIPSLDGYLYLIKNNNDTNFGAGPGPLFNDENIIINTLNALYQGNPSAKAAFEAILGGSTGADALAAVYNFIIPAASRSVDGLNYFKSQVGFYAARAAELGISGETGTAVVAFAALTKIAVDNGIGGLGDSLNDLIGAVNNGTAVIPQSGAVFTDLEVADGTQFDANDVPASKVPPIYSIAVSSPSALEGNAGQGSLFTYTVSRAGDVSKAGSVGLTYLGTADIGVDFDLLPANSIVSFAAGASTATFTATVKPDTQVEPNETISFLISSITGGGVIGTSNRATATIIDDDAAAAGPVYTISATPSSVAEGNSGPGNTITYTVARSGDVSKPGSVTVSLSGTADGSDYTTTDLVGGVVSFAAGHNQVTFMVTTTPDMTIEPNETVVATLGTITGGGSLGATTTVTATITNDDAGNTSTVNLAPGGASTVRLSPRGDVDHIIVTGFSISNNKFASESFDRIIGGAVAHSPGDVIKIAGQTMSSPPILSIIEIESTILPESDYLLVGDNQAVERALGTALGSNWSSPTTNTAILYVQNVGAAIYQFDVQVRSRDADITPLEIINVDLIGVIRDISPNALTSANYSL